MGFFFKDKKADPKEVISKKIAPKGPTVIGGVTPSVEVVVGLPTSGTDYNQYIDKVMQNANTAGPDYYEFAGALRELEGQALSEQQKYSVTYPTYKGMGVKPEELVKSAGHYLEVLQKESIDFSREMELAKEAQVSAKLARAQQEQAAIELLTAQIQDKNTEIQKLKAEANAASNTLAAEEHAFNNAYKNRVAQINDHIEKIQNYLK